MTRSATTEEPTRPAADAPAVPGLPPGHILPKRKGLKPCDGDCVIRFEDCRPDCTGHVMQARNSHATGWKSERAVAQRAWEERQHAKRSQTAIDAGNGKRKRNPHTGHFLSKDDVEMADLGPEVTGFVGQSPVAVLRHFFPHLVEDSRANWLIFLKAAFNEPLTDDERTVFGECTGRTQEFVEAVREIWLICGRRAGKSEIVAFLAIYLSCFRKYKNSRGEKVIGMVLAADREQAGVIMGYISEMLHSHKRLEALIKKRGSQFRETKSSITLTTGITIRVNTSNYRRVRGYTIAFVLCDEIAFWESEDAANPDKEVLKALRPALGTTQGMLICLSSPYWEKGVLHETYVKHHGKDDSKIFVWKAATRVMNPTFPQEDIDAAYEEDAASASAEYGAEFRTDVQALFETKAIDAVASDEIERPPQPNVTYRGFVDPAGGSGQDSMTLAIGHSEDGEEVLDLMRERRPPFNPDDVTKEFAETLRMYRLNAVTGDRYAGEWPRERFRAHGIEYQLADKTKNEIYKAFLPLVNGKRVRLLAEKRMRAQMQALERRTGRGGKDTIDHPRNGHDDIINAAAGVLVGGTSGVQYRVRCVGGDAPHPPGSTVISQPAAA